MSGEQIAYSWTQPCCEACWIEDRGEWDLDSDEQSVWQHIISVPKPTIVLDSPLERCAFCGRPTIVGIYVRHDPTEVPFPARKEIEDVDTGGRV